MKKRDDNNVNDEDLWQEVTKTVNPMSQDYIFPETQIKERKIKTSSLITSKTKKKLSTISSVIPTKPLNQELRPADLTAEKVSGISRTDAKRIRSGHITPTARLDLHGMSLERAHQALRQFIAAKQLEKHQHVLVITGKGTTGKGVIRQSLPNWLDEAPLSEQVVAFHTAKPKDGGTGAWYIKLRQKT